MCSGEQGWTKAIAQGVMWVVVAAALSPVVVNLVAFLVPILTGLHVEGAEARSATIQLGMAWVGLIRFAFAVALAWGVWKGTPTAALEWDAAGPWFRLGLRGLILTLTLMLAMRVVLRLSPEMGGGTALGWVTHAVWWAFVLLGMEYARRILVRLDNDKLARRTRVVTLVYLILVAVGIGLDGYFAGRWPEGISAGTSSFAWFASFIVASALLAIVAFILLASTLWKLRQFLLQRLPEPLGRLREPRPC